MANLSPCFQAFLVALTTPVRAQVRQLLSSTVQMMQAQLAILNAQVGRHDILAQKYQNSVNQINTMLNPLENIFSLLPLDGLQGCTEGTILFGNLQNRYFDYKSQAQDLAYKYAQFGFARTYSNRVLEELQTQITRINQVIAYLDQLASGSLQVGSRVMVYPLNKKGTVTGLSFPTVSVNLDVGGPTTAFAGDTGLINT